VQPGIAGITPPGYTLFVRYDAAKNKCAVNNWNYAVRYALPIYFIVFPGNLQRIFSPKIALEPFF